MSGESGDDCWLRVLDAGVLEHFDLKVSPAGGEKRPVRRVGQAIDVGGEARENSVRRPIWQIVGVNAVTIGATGDETTGGGGGRGVRGWKGSRGETATNVGEGNGDGRVILETVPNANLAIAAASDELAGIFSDGRV